MKPSIRQCLAVAAAAALTLTVVSPGTATAATGSILQADSVDRIANQYIVQLADTETSMSIAAQQLSNKYHADITQTYSHTINGFAATMDESDALALAADPLIESVTADRSFTIDAVQTNPANWGLTRIDEQFTVSDSDYTYPDSAGEGVTVYDLSTGVRISHDEFGNRGVSGPDFIDDDDDADDCNGLGTFNASVIAGEESGVAKKATVVAVRVIDCNGSGTFSGIIAGIDWVTNDADGRAIANFPIGGGIDSSLDAAVAASINSGVGYAVSAGASADDACNYSPARVEGALTVSAATESDSGAPFGNWGDCVNIYAPGVNITAAWHTSDTDFSTLSGTSVAAAFAAGSAALYLAENPTATAADAMGALVDNSTLLPSGINMLYMGFMNP